MEKFVISSLLSGFFLFLFPSFCWATNYYVAKNGNDTNSGTLDRPFLTIQKGATTAQAGDTVLIRNGTYNEKVTIVNSGSLGSFIHFTAYSSENVILDGSGINLGNWGGLFEIKGQYIKVSSLHLQNSGWFGFYINGSTAENIIIQNNTTYNTKSSGIYANGNSYITVDGNDIQRAVNGGSQECISFESVSNFEISRNTVHNGVNLDLGGEGIDVKVSSAYGKVHHNHIYDLPGEVGLYLDAYSGDLHDVEMYANQSSAPDGIVLSAEQGGTLYNIKVYNNLVYNSSDYGILVSNWMPGNEGAKRNIEITNNTVYQNSRGGITIAANNVTGPIIINNNLLSQNSSYQLSVSSTAASKVSANNNLFYGSGGTYGNNPQQGDPKFASLDPANPDFLHLTLSSSLAIDKGTSEYAQLIDYEGQSRPQPPGGGYDIGAYEYVNGFSPTPIPPHCSPLGDIDCNAKVNGLDFGYLVKYWGLTSYPAANLDDTGTIDTKDTLILFKNFLTKL